IADRLLPFMGGDAMRQWVICALDALYARDVQALQHQLPALMKACDELVLDQLAPVPREQAAPEAPHAQEGSVDARASVTAQDDALEVHPCVETHGLGTPASATSQDDALEAHPCVETHDLGVPASITSQDDAPEVPPCVVTTRDLGDSMSVTELDAAFEARSCVEAHGFGRHTPVFEVNEALEKRGLSCLAPAAEANEALEAAPRTHGSGLLVETFSGSLSSPCAQGLAPRESGGEVTGSFSGCLSDCRAGWAASSPEGDLRPGDPSTDLGPSHESVLKDDGLLHGPQGMAGRWAARLWRFIAHFLGPPAS
ncbi:hypothetical protein D7W81_01310, partial [Corallococcus aberystwythensis]